MSFEFRESIKRIVSQNQREYPSKSHSLIYFVEKLELKLEDSTYEFLFMPNKISVPTRYPEDLRKLVAAYSKERTDTILNRTKEIQLWIKQHSDIDLIIISADFRNKDIFERSKMTMKPEIATLKKYKVSMDILNLSPEEYADSKLKMYFESKIVA